MPRREKALMQLVILLVTNAFPLYGILALGWSAWEVILLYWVDVVLLVLINPIKIFFTSRSGERSSVLFAIPLTAMWLAGLGGYLVLLHGMVSGGRIEFDPQSLWSIMTQIAPAWWAMRWTIVGFLLKHVSQASLRVDSDPFRLAAIFEPLRHVSFLAVIAAAASAASASGFTDRGIQMLLGVLLVVMVTTADVSGWIWDMVEYRKGVARDAAGAATGGTSRRMTLESFNRKQTWVFLPAFVLGLVGIFVSTYWHYTRRNALQEPLPVSAASVLTIANVNTEVRVSGMAADAKAGAVILTDDQTRVYIDGLDFWPDGFLAESVAATGTLQYTEYVPGGEDFVLLGAQWGKI